MSHPPYAFYYLDGDGESHDIHPGLNDLSEQGFRPEDFTPSSAFGFLHPDMYQTRDWTWAPAGGYQEAIVNALNEFRRVSAKHLLCEQAWQQISDDTSRRTPLLRDKAPAYHPTQRSNEDEAARSNRYELKISTALLAVGHSLVVVEPANMPQGGKASSNLLIPSPLS